MNGATFVARGYSADTKQLCSLMKQAIEHKGFSLISIFSPCVTFNHDNDYSFFKPRVIRLEDEGHDSNDWKAACEKAMVWGDTIYTGLFFQNKDKTDLGQREPVLDDDVPICQKPLALSEDQANNIISRMM